MTTYRSSADIAVVLGAGASVPPLLSQQDLVETLRDAPDHPRLLPAKAYLKRTFRGLRQSGNPRGILRFEEILGPLEIAEAEEYWFHFGGNDKRNQNRIMTNAKVLDSLDTWVAMSLDPPTLPKPKVTKQENGRRFYELRSDSSLPYARFLWFLGEKIFLPKTIFISMNYDLLLDRVLNTSNSFFPDYDLEDFVKDDEHENRHPSRTAVKVLKLHGSLNWRMCEECHLLRDTGNDVVWPQSQCNDCGSKTARPMLIRPTLLKDFRHRIWRDVWRKAGHVLAAASHWIFIGYSLPMADVWMLRLLAQSARSGGVDTHIRRVTVVNPDSSALYRFRLLFPTAKGYLGTFDSWIGQCIQQGALLEGKNHGGGPPPGGHPHL